MKTNHTQEKWVTDGHLDNLSVIASNSVSRKLICNVKCYDHHKPNYEETEANAKLIAAAPEMLSALNLAREELIRLRGEMLKPQEERDSFWISAFLNAPMCGSDLISLADKVIRKATE